MLVFTIATKESHCRYDVVDTFCQFTIVSFIIYRYKEIELVLVRRYNSLIYVDVRYSFKIKKAMHFPFDNC